MYYCVDKIIASIEPKSAVRKKMNTVMIGPPDLRKDS